METNTTDRRYSVDPESTKHLLEYKELLSENFVNARTEFNLMRAGSAVFDADVLDCVTCYISDLEVRSPLDGSKGKDVIVKFTAFLDTDIPTPVEFFDNTLLNGLPALLLGAVPVPTKAIAFGYEHANELLLGRFTRGLTIPEISKFIALRDELIESAFFLQRAGYVAPTEEDDDYE